MGLTIAKYEKVLVCLLDILNLRRRYHIVLLAFMVDGSMWIPEHAGKKFLANVWCGIM